jgi:CspA family cold shock protein
MNQQSITNCTGTVKWFSRLKGYGFITPDNGGQEVFVHYSAIEGVGYRNLHEGDPVEYELSDRGRGPIAVSVRVYRGRPWPVAESEE